MSERKMRARIARILRRRHSDRPSVLDVDGARRLGDALDRPHASRLAGLARKDPRRAARLLAQWGRE